MLVSFLRRKNKDVGPTGLARSVRVLSGVRRNLLRSSGAVFGVCPGIIGSGVAPPFDQVLEFAAPVATVDDFLHLVVIFALNDVRFRRRYGLWSAGKRPGSVGAELHYVEYGVDLVERYG